MKIIALTSEVGTLQKKIVQAGNSTEGTSDLSVLNRELQDKVAELKAKLQEIQNNHANSSLIIHIISLQNQIWDLEQAESKKGATSLQPNRRIMVLELISVHSKILMMQRLISAHIEESRSNAADYQRQWRQKTELLKRKIVELNRDESNTALTQEILVLQAEVMQLKQLISNGKKTTDHQLKELRLILEEEKKRKENLQKQLEEADYSQSLLIMQLINLMKEVRELQANQQDNTSTSTSQATTLQTLLQAKEREYAKAQAEINEMQRKLQLKNKECSSLEERHEQVKTELQEKITELKRSGDSNAALILNVINLHDELRTLKDLNSTTEDPKKISELQRQLKEKQDELNSKTADIERLIANPKIILKIIELQDEIFDLQKKAANETTSGRVIELQNRVDGLITEIDDKSDTKLILKVITLQSQVEQLQRQLSDLQMLRNTQVTQLRNDLTAKKNELQKYINDLNEKNQTSAQLILNVTDLQNQLRNIEIERHNDNTTWSLTITQLREQLKAERVEQSRDRAQIKALQNQLNETEAQCSGFEEKLKNLQNDLDAKMKELESKADTVTSLALQVSTLTLQLEELKKQLQNTESETKIKELKKTIDEKTNELAKKTEELNARSSQAQRLLQIIAIQTEIEKLASEATNDTDYNKITALQDHLTYLIDGIQDENNENTKLMFQILAQQDELARLKKQEESQTKADLEKIKVLENELEDIRNQIKEKTQELTSSDTRITDLSAEIAELKKKIKPLEDEISDLKEANAERLEELQKRLDLTKRQLQDSELRLKGADAKNFQSIMEIADLRAQLKKAQKQATRAAQQNVTELEQQLQTKERENKELEKTNKAMEITNLTKELRKLQVNGPTSASQVTALQTLLQAKEREYAKVQAEINEMQRKLQLKNKECSSLEERHEQVKTELQEKITELKRSGDSNAALILNVINLHDELRTLKDLNSTTEDPKKISELQRQLKEKQDELNSKTADIERLIANPKIILKIIELQDEIFDLQKKAANETTSGRVIELQNRVDGLITEIDDKSDTKLILKVITLQSQVEQLQRQLSDLQMLRNTQVTQLRNDLTAKKNELQKYINDLNEKNQTSAQLILNVTDLQNQLRNIEIERHNDNTTWSLTITQLREQLKAERVEQSRDRAQIKALQNQLNETEAQCSGFEEKLKNLQNDLDAKIKELQSKSDTVTSLALQVSTLTLQLEELKKQLQNTESETKIKELQKIIDEKTNELAQKTEELNARSSQPERFLQIIAIQTEIEKLVNVATNDTDYNKITALQDHLNNLIDGIQDENNENTKLMFQILSQQDELARLKKQEESQTKADLEKIKVLENELEDIRNQIKDKTQALDFSDTRIADLSAQIMELHKKIKPLEDEISALKDVNADRLKELQKRLDLTKRQLQDSELRLKAADAKNFQSTQNNTALSLLVMEIADLRAQLKKAQKQATRAAQQNVTELEQQLQTKEGENRKLEKTNKDLQQEVNDLNMCCTNANTLCEDLQHKLQQSQEDVDRLLQQLNEKEATLEQQQQKLDDQVNENNRLQSDYYGMFNPLEALICMKIHSVSQRKGSGWSCGYLRETLNGEEDTTIYSWGKWSAVTLEEEGVARRSRWELTRGRENGGPRRRYPGRETAPVPPSGGPESRPGGERTLEKRTEECPHQKTQRDLQHKLQQSQEDVDRLLQQLNEKEATLEQQQQKLDDQVNENNRLQSDYYDLRETLNGEEDTTIYSWKMTFNPDTANPRIVLSPDKTKMFTSAQVQNVPDNPGRFDVVLAALGSTGFSTGRQYWEVSVAGKLCYHLGMASESVQRKGHMQFSPRNGFWTIVLNKLGQFRAIDQSSVHIPVQTQPLTLGILLDYKKGQISFYDVGAKSHMYSFNGQKFTDKIYPFVNFCVEDAAGPTPISLLPPTSTDWIK
ncbi:hypothetical protein L3Q82_021788 [Scortum barcoo]|uniref:Uncharacterized protein n=1 Tax=Scortum barcoo TaxID=214431 RepID=A0ACB8X5A8_9TELE|nr:hypothetical protein L3Q82_021788 [Scortum barcoo]